MATGGSNFIEESDKMQDETFDFLCSLCALKNKNIEADKYCVDCLDYYCSECVKFHDNIPALSKHELLDEDKFRSTTGSADHPVPTERCDIHKHNHVDMYCQDHNEVGCPTCMLVYHRSCKDTFYIPDYTTNQNTVKNFKTTNKKLKEITKNLHQHKDNFERRRSKVLENKEQLLQKVYTLRGKINARLDTLEQVSITEIEEATESVLEKIQDDLQELEQREELVLSAANNLASCQNNISQTFINIKKSDTITKQVETFLQRNQPEEENEEINFEVNDFLLEMLNEMESLIVSIRSKDKTPKDVDNSKGIDKAVLNDLKVITEKKTDENQKETLIREFTVENNPEGVLWNFNENKPKYHQYLNEFKLKARKTFDLKYPSDLSTPNIYSICILYDGTLVLADFSNFRLKRVERLKFSILDYCDIPSKPWQVCTIEENKVAVSCQDSGIQFVSIHPKMKKTWKIKLKYSCRGLAYTNGKLYVSGLTSINMYFIKGINLEQFAKISSDHIFTAINALSVSNDGFFIYVADIEKGLIILDKNGHVVGKYNNKPLMGANYVSATENGSVLIAGYHSRNVLQLGPQSVSEILRIEKTKVILSVYHDNLSNKIIISSTNDRNIEVYDI